MDTNSLKRGRNGRLRTAANYPRSPFKEEVMGSNPIRATDPASLLVPTMTSSSSRKRAWVRCPVKTMRSGGLVRGRALVRRSSLSLGRAAAHGDMSDAGHTRHREHSFVHWNIETHVDELDRPRLGHAGTRDRPEHHPTFLV